MSIEISILNEVLGLLLPLRLVRRLLRMGLLRMALSDLML
jgi:hypothetical protein